MEEQPELHLLSLCLGWILTGRTKVDEDQMSNNNDVHMSILQHWSSESKRYTSVDEAVPAKHALED
jgi:hypothetical protein